MKSRTSKFQAASSDSTAIAKMKPFILVPNKLLPDQNASRWIIPHPDCPKVLSVSTVREFGLALCSPVNRPHLLPQELDIQGISTPFSLLRLLSNTSYRKYVGTVIPCNFHQAVPDIQHTPKVLLSWGVRPWPAEHVRMQRFVMNGIEFLTDRTYPSSLTITSLYGFFKTKTLVSVVSAYIAPERSDQNICSTSNILFPIQDLTAGLTATICCHAKSACATHLSILN